MGISYDAFAPHFDAWQRSFGCAYDDLILPRIVDVLGRHAPAARRIADLGIGTGDLAIALARRGYDLVGVDVAPAMLAVARAKAARAGVRLTLVEQDLRALRLEPPADVVLCVYTVVNQLTADGDLDRALASIHRSLVPHGLLVFELNLAASYERYWSGEETVDVGDAVVVRTHRRREGSAVIEADVSIRRRSCGGWDEVRDHIAQRPYGDDEVEAALVRGGFDRVACERYDPFDENAQPTKALWTCRRV
ncbi:MAG TPA: class I SAM-dependent methyltransferase [Candidatus Eisenbacteria bacterium]|nr:class I SAM-dependent methyltransferase [Candidatus Eisenbacteria bacterium]